MCFSFRSQYNRVKIFHNLKSASPYQISTHPNSTQQESNHIYLFTTKFGTSIKIWLNRKFESTEFETMRITGETSGHWIWHFYLRLFHMFISQSVNLISDNIWIGLVLWQYVYPFCLCFSLVALSLNFTHHDVVFFVQYCLFTINGCVFIIQCDAGFSSSKFRSSCLPFVVKQTTLPVSS
jgi:hypothetical protein